jgi:hypothetical protein
MGIFDFFKKDKTEAQINFTVNTMKVGFMVDYFMKTWEVKKVYTYDWGNNFYSKEYLLDSGDETIYLSVEEDDKLICSIWNKLDIFEIDSGLVNSITSTDDAPDKLVYENKTFIRKESSQGSCQVDGESEDSELVNWMYKNPETKELLSIDRFGEEEFGAAKGNYVKEFEFSNILPR